MSQTEPLKKHLSPTEIERLNRLISGELAGRDLPTPEDEDIQRCFAVLQGSAKVCSHDSDQHRTESSVTVRFSLPRFVGSGGYGVVFLVHDNVLGIEVAIKMLRPSRNSPVVQQRFLEEARITASLNHPGIIRLYDSGLIDNIPYITSAIADEGSLRELIDKNPNGLAEATACRIMADVADAVAYAHSKLTFHRDIKPGNILLTKGTEPNQPKPIVSDFGLAKRWDKTEAGLTREGDILGTTRYMSPEQARGDLEEYSVVSEVFTLGIILYELLSGKLPFEGSTNTEIRRSITSGRPFPLTKGVTGLSGDVLAIVHKCLEKKAEDRYESVSALAKDLRSLLAGQPVTASRPSLVRILKWKAKEHPWLAAGLGLAISLIAVVAAGFAYVGWAQSQSLKREHQTKIAYVILLGKFVDDVVEGEMNQQVAILQSLESFEKNLLNDLRSNPKDQDLRHLLSLIYNYESVTQKRLGDLRNSFLRRIDSIRVLRELSEQYPSNTKYRFQFLNGLANAFPMVDHSDVEEDVGKLYEILGCKDQFGLARLTLSVIGSFENDISKPDYVSAANDFRLRAASVLSKIEPQTLRTEYEKTIASSLSLAKEHPDNPLYIKPALTAYTNLANTEQGTGNGAAALDIVAKNHALIQEYLQPHRDKQSVLTVIVIHGYTHVHILYKNQRFSEALQYAREYLRCMQEITQIDANVGFWRSMNFHLTSFQYLCLKQLGRIEEASNAYQELVEAAKRVRENEYSLRICLEFVNPVDNEEEVMSLLKVTDTAEESDKQEVRP